MLMRMTAASRDYVLVISGQPEKDDESLGAQLLRIRDPQGRPMPDERLLPNLGILFFAATDTTGHTMANTLCVRPAPSPFLHMRPHAQARLWLCQPRYIEQLGGSIKH